MTYTTISGDEWDGICYKVYGDEMMMEQLMQANLEHINTVVFRAGVVLTVPDVEKVVTASDLPPWMR